jgi:hypothetical protein
LNKEKQELAEVEKKISEALSQRATKKNHFKKCI